MRALFVILCVTLLAGCQDCKDKKSEVINSDAEVAAASDADTTSEESAKDTEVAPADSKDADSTQPSVDAKVEESDADASEEAPDAD